MRKLFPNPEVEQINWLENVIKKQRKPNIESLQKFLCPIGYALQEINRFIDSENSLIPSEKNDFFDLKNQLAQLLKKSREKLNKMIENPIADQFNSYDEQARAMFGEDTFIYMYKAIAGLLNQLKTTNKVYDERKLYKGIKPPELKDEGNHQVQDPLEIFEHCAEKNLSKYNLAGKLVSGIINCLKKISKKIKGKKLPPVKLKSHFFYSGISALNQRVKNKAKHLSEERLIDPAKILKRHPW